MFLILYQVLSVKQKKINSQKSSFDFATFPGVFSETTLPYICYNYYLKRNMSFLLVFLKTCRILFATCKRIEFNLSISSILTPMQVADCAEIHVLVFNRRKHETCERVSKCLIKLEHHGRGSNNQK